MTLLERDVEAWLVAETKRRGGIAYKFTRPQRRSVPDRLILMPGGEAFFVELKAPGKKPTEAQVREHERIRALGFRVYVSDAKEWPCPHDSPPGPTRPS